MTAFAGIVARKGHARYQQALTEMVSALRYDRCNAAATYVDDGCAAYLGWIAPDDRAASGRLEYSADRSIVILLHGEESVFAEGDRAASKRSAGAELIRAYEQQGAPFVKGAPGMTAGVLVDTGRQVAVVWTDRYGIRRIYYHQDDDAFLFSTQAKAILRVRPELRRVDDGALAEYFAVGSPLDHRTLFRGISMLPGGTARVFDRGAAPKPLVYFSRSEWENQPRLTADAFYRQMSDTFSTALPRYFNGGARAGLSLTGGVDSRVLLACHPLTPGSLPCYTFAGADSDTLDVRLARRLANATGQRHDVLRLGSEFLAKFPDLAAETVYRTDATFDVCGTHEIYLNTLASHVAPARVTGNFGSELFRGVRTLGPLSLSRDVFVPEFQRSVLEAERTFGSTLSPHPLSCALFDDIPKAQYGCLTAAESRLTIRSPYLDYDLAALMYRMPAELTNSPEVQLRLVRDRRPGLLSLPTDSGLGANLPRPLRPLQQFLSWASFKTDYRTVEGLPGAWARFDPLFAALNPFRFYPGAHRFLLYRRWFRQELYGFVMDTLTDRSTAERPYLDRKTLQRLLREHASGRRNWTQEINKLLSVELIHRLLIDRKPDRADATRPVSVVV